MSSTDGHCSYYRTSAISSVSRYVTNLSHWDTAPFDRTILLGID